LNKTFSKLRLLALVSLLLVPAAALAQDPRTSLASLPDADVPGYGVGQVDLAEGPRVQSILLGGRDDFEIGMELEIDLETLRENRDGDEIVIYRFHPVGDAVTGSAG
jgi:hypothetical protein